jgi:glycosyltransferase involved in cell wall biosynthesis
MKAGTLEMPSGATTFRRRPAQLPSQRSAASVVIASLNRPRGTTGVHTHTQALEQGLSALGCSCSVISPFSAGVKWLPAFALRPLLIHRISATASTLWYRHWHEAALRSALTAQLEQNSADVILAQCPVSAHAALHVRRHLKLNCRIAMVCHFNRSEADEYRSTGELSIEWAYQRMLEYEAAVLHEVDQVIYVSQWARGIVEDQRRILPRSSVVIHNGIPDSDAAPLTRKSVGLADDDVVLINVGTLEPRKNQLGLIALFERIVNECAKAKLLLVGSGSARAAIETEIQARGLAGKVLLLGSRADVPSLLKLSDVYLHYAKLENCPVILLECARAGLPFAAIPAGGIPEVQAQMGVQFALDENDPEQSLHTLRPLLAERSRRLEIGRVVRLAYLQRFTTDVMASRYLDSLNLTAKEQR